MYGTINFTGILTKSPSHMEELCTSDTRGQYMVQKVKMEVILKYSSNEEARSRVVFQN